ncbi:MAG TPA: hypothetical protein VH859_05620 [Candidatus Limnocylindria bacterium]
MLLRPDVLAAIAEGRVDLAFRRWERPRVRPGGSQRTAIGVIGFGDVRVVAADDISEDEARRAGFADRPSLLNLLDRRTAGEIYRIELGLVGPDPRVRLREALPDAAELAALRGRLERLDGASRHGPWTAATLRAIGEQPATKAVELAASLGRERLPFKLDVRKLKELGLTESLERGYRLSPRGRAVLDALSADALSVDALSADALGAGEPPPAQPRTRPSRSPRRGGR